MSGSPTLLFLTIVRLGGKPLVSKKPGFERKSVCSRKLRSIDKDQFVQDIKDSSLMNHQDFRDVSALSGCYDNTLRSLLDHYAPIKKYTVTVRPAAPWYSDNI